MSGREPGGAAAPGARVVPLPGIAIPAARAAAFDPSVARTLEALRRGDVVPDAGPVPYPEPPPGELARLAAALDAAFPGADRDGGR